jgi:hypothetical protein
MRNKLTLLIGLLVLAFAVNAQKLNNPVIKPGEKVWAPAEKIIKQDRTVPKAAIYTQDFSTGALPDGWQNVDNTGGGVLWVFDNPGERDFFSTTAANGFATFDSDYFGGVAEGEDTDLISAVIDCSANTGTIVLSYETYFRDGWGGAGAVSVSGDNGATWTELTTYGGGVSTANAAYESFDISAIAAGQAEVLVKFKWTGDYSWYWMIDDFAVAEVTANDEFAVTEIDAPLLAEVGTVYTLSGAIKNNGLTRQDKPLVFKADGVLLDTVWSDSLDFGQSQTLTYDWTPAAGGYVSITAEIPADEDPSNDMQEAGVDVYEAGQLVEEFEGDFLPFGWSETAVAKNWGRSTNPVFQIVGLSALIGQDINSPAEMLITPPLVLDGSVQTLSFWAAGVNNNFDLGSSTLLLKYKEVGTDTWMVLGDTIDFADGQSPMRVEADLSGLTNGNYYFAFETESTFDYTGYTSYALVDNVVGPQPMTLNTITFNVIDGVDPLEGVEIMFGTMSAVTDATGAAEFGVIDGTYDWTAMLEGYYDETGTEVVAGDATVDVTMNLMPVARFTVHDGVDPIEGANIAIDGQDITTDVDGMAMISLPDGTYEFTASMPGYFDSIASVTLEYAVEDTTDVNVELIIMPVYDITFTVTDGTDPIEGAEVMVAGQMIATDVNGEAVATGLFDDVYSWVAYDSAYLDAYGDVTVSGADATVDVTMEMVPAGMVLFTDDFEGYEVGDLVAANSNYWETWTGAAGGGGDDAAVSDDFANSPTKSMLIADGGADDMIFPLGDKSAGLFYVSFYIYIESGADYEGYFNFQGTSTPGDVFAFENYFLQDGTATINVNGETTYNYTQDSWEFIEIIVDLDNDYASMRLNGDYITSWEYVENLGGIDIFAGADSGTPKFYVDDITYRDLYFSGGYANFTVTDDASTPVEGANIEINGMDYTTDAAGQISVLLDDGTYPYTITALGFVDYSDEVIINAADETVDVMLTSQYSITFNLNMSNADFNPDTDRVWVSGAKADGSAGIGGYGIWPWPQSELDFELLDPDGDLTYTLTVDYVDPGEYVYRYGYTIPGPPNWNNPFPEDDSLSFTIVDQDEVVDDMWNVGVENTNVLSDFNIYPNPTNGIVTVGTNEQVEVTVTNAIGKVILNKVVGNNETLDLSSQTQGLYFISAKTNDAVKTLRLIVE